MNVILRSAATKNLFVHFPAKKQKQILRFR
jgi:hypothetical protein